MFEIPTKARVFEPAGFRVVAVQALQYTLRWACTHGLVGVALFALVVVMVVVVPHLLAPAFQMEVQ